MKLILTVNHYAETELEVTVFESFQSFENHMRTVYIANVNYDEDEENAAYVNAVLKFIRAVEKAPSESYEFTFDEDYPTTYYVKHLP